VSFVEGIRDLRAELPTPDSRGADLFQALRQRLAFPRIPSRDSRCRPDADVMERANVRDEFRLDMVLLRVRPLLPNGITGELRRKILDGQQFAPAAYPGARYTFPCPPEPSGPVIL